MDAVLCKFSEQLAEMLEVVLERGGEDDNIVHVCTSKATKIPKNRIHHPLNIGDRVPVAHDGAIEGLLSPMTSNGKLMLVRWLNLPRIEKGSAIYRRNVGTPSNDSSGRTNGSISCRSCRGESTAAAMEG